jgi:secondary thiamine-phosphate synthase enzyme
MAVTMTIRAEKMFTDITDILQGIVDRDGVTEGCIVVYCHHTTCGLKVMENELLSLSDIDDFLEGQIPQNGKYAHDKIHLREVPVTERINAASHIRMLYFQSAITIPIVGGKIPLGEWQTIFLVDLDYAPSRERTLTVVVMHEV